MASALSRVCFGTKESYKAWRPRNDILSSCFHGQAPLSPSAGGAGYALRLQGQQCLEVSLAGLEETDEAAVGVWLNPSQVRIGIRWMFRNRWAWLATE